MSAGVVYLLHQDPPGYAHARHYTGWTADLAARLALHEQGQGARLLAVARAAGIGWTLARTWPALAPGSGRSSGRAVRPAAAHCAASSPGPADMSRLTHTQMPPPVGHPGGGAPSPGCAPAQTGHRPTPAPEPARPDDHHVRCQARAVSN